MPSPDGKKIIYVGPSRLDVAIGDRLISLRARATVESLAELMWSPDSATFVVTESEGGNVGPWLVTLYRPTEQGLEAINPGSSVARSFKKYYRCCEPEKANIGAVAWISSSELLLAAEVPPHSSCSEMGKLRGYIVELPSGRVLKELDESSLRAEWGSYLGARLRR